MSIKDANRATPDTYDGLELVQLADEKIVSADSEEGKALKASHGQSTVAGAAKAAAPTNEQACSAQIHSGHGSAALVDDEVHNLRLSMGLSERAWSQTPAPQIARQ